MTDLKYELQKAMTQSSPALKFRDAVKHCLETGGQKSQLNEELERLRQEVGDKEEDVILEVLDFLQGWSHPDLRL